MRVKITDDGGPVLGRAADGFGIVSIGSLEIWIQGHRAQAAERIRAIAGELERLAAELEGLTSALMRENPADELTGAAATAAISVAIDAGLPTYLGDGVYAAFDAGTLNVILTASDGRRRIVLEPDVLDALGRFTQSAIFERQRRKP